MQVADIAIVGAGANGLSTAFHLARAKAGKIVVVERRHLGAGATGKSGALVRTNYANEPETRLALESMTYFKHWDDLVGGDCGYQPVGLLFFTRPEHAARLEANVALHRKLGVNTRIISPDEALALDPSLSLADVTHVGYEPESGFADPNATIYSFARAAQDMGVELQLNTEVTRILVEGQRVTGVETSNGIIQAPTVVIVAGAWANNLFAPLHIDLGLTPRRAKVVVFRWSYERAPQHLTYLDRINLMWARPIDDNCTLVGVDLEHFFEAREPDTYPEAVEQAYIDVCREQLAKRFPAMRHSTMRGNWACMLMQSPDGHPMIGSLPQYTGLFCMAGDSGTSFKTSPAIGKCLGELITEGQATTVDLTPFRPSRFSEGAPWHDDFDYGNNPITISR